MSRTTPFASRSDHRVKLLEPVVTRRGFGAGGSGAGSGAGSLCAGGSPSAGSLASKPSATSSIIGNQYSSVTVMPLMRWSGL